MYYGAVMVAAVLLCAHAEASSQKQLDRARAYLSYLDKTVCRGKFEQVAAEFNYYTDVTEDNLKAMNEQDARAPLFDAKIINISWASIDDPTLVREAKFYSLIDRAIDQSLYDQLNQVIRQMLDTSNKPYCLYENRSVCDDSVYADIEDSFYNSRDAKRLAYYWLATHDGIPQAARKVYKKYVDISNQVAKQIGYSNNADYWMDQYEDPNFCFFESTMLQAWSQIKPLYLQFYSYYRHRLRQVFGEKVVPLKGPIPAHLLGSFAGEDFQSGIKEIDPYPGKPFIGETVTDSLNDQKYNVRGILDMVEDFYQSLGLEKLPDTFYSKSVFAPRKGKTMVTSPAAWDYFNGKDYRLSFDASVDYFSLVVFLNQLGRLHYYMGYKNQPCCFKIPPNTAFEQALGDTIGLSFLSHKHLSKLNLAGQYDKEVEINNYFVQAKEKLSFVPYNLAVDLWRWHVFKGKISADNYNKAYWAYRLRYQGVVPPTARSEGYLDAAQTVQVLQDRPMIGNFLSIIMNFQLLEGLCIAAGEYDPKNPSSKPLADCELYGSTKAGNLLKKVYALGASEPYTAGLHIVTGKRSIDAGAMVRYFEPLYKWLVAENKRTGEFIGWD